MTADQVNPGRLLNIDLNNGYISRQVIKAKQMKRFIGGCGVNVWLLFNRIDEETDPLSPSNPLIFGADPLVGTSYPTSAPNTVTALSPLTKIYGDSNGGGIWGVMMHSVGVDHLVICGALKKPGYLFISAKGECSLKDASDLWGMTTTEAVKAIKSRHPRSVAAVIGPAGESLVRYANISFENNAHSFSRSGMGAVMGSKKLKAMVIARGAKKKPDPRSGKIKVAWPGSKRLESEPGLSQAVQ
ncbi:aldehyde ferredoxin oxidoreductase N-terminal domain-containing protein [Dethiosulfatarculus sandiegensis]|uniref:Aldehyde ferredoxin oxidoreductase N-terminal domain-containing protein n=1 Tax=Dethiosulfatarculus sandiegensis TaxID=1429043 RepID=A0A0D2K260_9BACT|nr:aldehyde ferredoxin oxidoreductase N-terminal domain-containing protein [Dethiosulfatarculus sandiegensis]KIX15765.1 hypothetical protein X474_03155 [Dethiosulfatarculus sandiegensis]